MSERLFAEYRKLDRRLVKAGFPATSPWWFATLERFLGHATAWQLICRVGRRGGKSSTLCRLAVLLALAVDWPIPPGDVGFVIFVSARTDDAKARLTTIEAILRALGIEFRRSDETIYLKDRPIAFKVVPATVAAASGPTSIAVIADEAAKWRDADTGANPAEEVLAALRPTLATMRRHGARMVLSSSPFGVLDAHAKAFDQGDTDGQVVAHAETWVANPTLTEDETHVLEPDGKKWRREYAAIPSATASAAFEFDDIGKCFRPQPAALKSTPVLILDPSSGGRDSFTWCVARWACRAKDDARVWYTWTDPNSGKKFWKAGRADGVRTGPLLDPHPDWPTYKWRLEPLGRDEVDPDSHVVIVEEVGGVDGRFAVEKFAEVVGKAAACAAKFGARYAFSDQREVAALHAHLGEHKLHYEAITWTNETKRTSVETVRRWMASGKLVLPDHERLRRQLAEYETRITPSGYETFAGRGAHDDYAALIVTLAMVEDSRRLPHSPLQPQAARGVITRWMGT